MRGVVVPDADLRLPERTGGHEREGVTDDDLGQPEAVAREIRLDLVERRVAHAEPVDSHEARALVAEHRGDEAGSVVDADLDVRLLLFEAARGQVDEREIVLAREALDVLRDRPEAAVTRMLGAWEVLEEPRELLEEAIRLH